MSETPLKFLIEHWSYSSLKMFLSNRLQFKKRYILKVYDDEKYSPSAVAGKACHKVVEEYYKGFDVDVGTDEGLKYINSLPDFAIKFGKTGSREDILKKFNAGVKYFFAEIPDFYKLGNVLAIEEKITAFINLNGQDMAIPAKSHIDMIFQAANGDIEINDWKFKAQYTDAEEFNWPYIIQAMFNYYTTLAYLKDHRIAGAPKRMIFWEVKLAANKNGDPQIQKYTIEFGDHPEYFLLMAKLYDDCTRALMGENLFLPNPTDEYDADDSMLSYMQGLIGSDVENLVVDHKEKIQKFVEKNYVKSAHDKVENKYITEEEKIRAKLQEFGIPVEMQETQIGASVILYTFKASRGVKMRTIEGHDQDIKVALKASSIRVLAPIPGTDLVGIEVPNPNPTIIDYVGPQLGAEILPNMNIPIGVDVFGKMYMMNLADMPHLLIAGATNSGKSVGLGVALQSLIDRTSPEDLKMILIDPKRVELSRFKNDPHLEDAIIYEDVQAAQAFAWAVTEMEQRYKDLEEAGARDIDAYIAKGNAMHRIVIAVDEFADLMLRDWSLIEVEHPENNIVRLAQKSRAVGIHLILATQRPSVDVITGLIKANIPTRIAFRTTSRVDSQIILDQAGAEELNGKGDLLLLNPSQKGVQRLQGFYL